MQNPVWTRLILVLVVLFGIVAVWRWSPLAEFIRPEVLAGWGSALRGHWWGYAAAMAVFVIGGLIVIPVTVLVAASALVFGPAAGFAVSMSGALLSGAAVYLVGDALGRRGLDLFAGGGRIEAASEALAERGILTMALVRQIPIAPYSVVNFAAGMSHIRFRDFMVGTGIGILPWMLALTLLTDQFFRMLQSPSLTNAAILAAASVVAVGLSVLAVRYVPRWLSRRGGGGPPER